MSSIYSQIKRIELLLPVMAKLITHADSENGDLTWLQTIWGHPIKRLFWINQVPDHVHRGEHRHPTCHMALQCLAGSVNVYVQTPTEDQFYTLESPNQYLLLEPEDWRSMHDFSGDAILLVLAEKSYELTNYVDEPYRQVLSN